MNWRELHEQRSAMQCGSPQVIVPPSYLFFFQSDCIKKRERGSKMFVLKSRAEGGDYILVAGARVVAGVALCS